MPQKPIIHFDGTFDIATGRNRKETNWKNKEMLWSDLVEKLSTTHETAETQAEYMAAKKPRQDEIKDIGGFVGGYLTGGRRKASNVMHRQLITLDIDYSKSLSFWDDFTMMYDNAALIYSTHKHSLESPRLRLIILLDRAVRPDEYEAIARRIAGNLDIELFDPTTFQPERLMYWPSTSKGAHYEFQYQDGPLLSADEVLATYHDWQDSSAWPVSERIDKILARSIMKQGDPLEKAGIIGAWCRTYSIEEVIEKYLPDVYEPCATEGRYTYKEGSTGAGLVIYDDKYAYSHHGTDPISGKLCNAFDLVRIHKFGLKDEDAREGTKMIALPSFKAMEDFAAKEPAVRKLSGIERMESAKYDFAEIKEEEEPEITDEDLAWLEELDVDRKNNPISSIDNIYLVLKNDKYLKKAFYYDEFEARLVVAKNLPWQKITGRSKDFSDMDFDCLAHYIERNYKMPFTQLQKALSKIMADFYVHPVRDYLNSVKWDGVPRLETLFIDFLGAVDDAYTRAATRKTFIAAVTRIFNPGTKFDTVLTLVGKQGAGKSTIIEKMAKRWYSDNLGKIHEKEGSENLRGVWLMEIAELASFKKTDQDAIKRFITSTQDMYRPSYGKFNIRFPRQCIFFATTNKEQFLSDPTGNRRFLPIATSVTQPTKNIFKDLDTEIDQLWAEAKTYYKQGESIDLSEELKEKAEQVREQFTIYDERAGLVEKYLDILLPDDWESMDVYARKSFIAGDILQPAGTVERTTVCVAEIWCEANGGMQKDMTTHNTKYIHEIMAKMKGWKPLKSPKRFKIYGPQRAYERTKNVNTNVNTRQNAANINKKIVNAVNTNVNAN